MEVGFFMLKRAFTLVPGELVLPPAGVAVGILILWILEAIVEKNEQVFAPLWERKGVCAAGAVALLFISFCIYSVTVSAQFIYFQF
jgi:hypothetical protein